MQPVERMVMENYLSKHHSGTFGSAIKRSLCVGVSDVDDDDDSFEDFMMIGMPSDVKHVTHVTFDRFRGFLGVPQDIERMLPGRAPSASQKVFGVKPESMQCSYDDHGNSVPTILLLLQARLYNQGGLQKEGIFRVAAGNDHEEHVRSQLSMGIVPKNIDVYALAGLIKAWFRELPEGVLDMASPEQMEKAARSEEESMKLVKGLPTVQRSLIDWAINLMADVAEYEPHNKMSPRNIAMVFAPNMTQVLDPVTALMHAVQVTNFLRCLVERKQKDRLNALNLATLQSLNSPLNSLSSTPGHSRQLYQINSGDLYSPQVPARDGPLFRTFSTPEQDLLPDGFVVEGSTDDNTSRANSGVLQADLIHEGFGLDPDDLDANWDSFPLDDEPQSMVLNRPLTPYSPADDSEETQFQKRNDDRSIDNRDDIHDDSHDQVRDVNIDSGLEKRKNDFLPSSLTQMYMAGWGDVDTNPGDENSRDDANRSYEFEYNEFLNHKRSKWSNEEEFHGTTDDSIGSAEVSSEIKDDFNQKSRDDSESRVEKDGILVMRDDRKERFESFDSTETFFSEVSNDIQLVEEEKHETNQSGQTSLYHPFDSLDSVKQKNPDGPQHQHAYESLSEVALKENELYNFAIQRADKRGTKTKRISQPFSKSRFNRELGKQSTDFDEEDDCYEDEDENCSKEIKDNNPSSYENAVTPIHNTKSKAIVDSGTDGDDEFSGDNLEFESQPLIVHQKKSSDSPLSLKGKTHGLDREDDPSSSVHELSIRMISTGSEINNIVISPSRDKREGGSLRYEIKHGRIGNIADREIPSDSSELPYSDASHLSNKVPLAVHEDSDESTETPSLIISINRALPENRNVREEESRQRTNSEPVFSDRGNSPDVSRKSKPEGSQLRLRRLKKAAEEAEGVNADGKKSTTSLHIGTPSMEIKVEQLVANVTMRFVGLLEDSPRPRTPVGFEAVSRSSTNKDNVQ